MRGIRRLAGNHGVLPQRLKSKLDLLMESKGRVDEAEQLGGVM